MLTEADALRVKIERQRARRRLRGAQLDAAIRKQWDSVKGFHRERLRKARMYEIPWTAYL